MSLKIVVLAKQVPDTRNVGKVENSSEMNPSIRIWLLVGILPPSKGE